MKSEEEFDELLRNKFSDESAFPFEEDKWARMEEMIIASEQKDKRRRFLLIYFCGFITALILIFPIYWFVAKYNVKEDILNKKANTQTHALSKNETKNTKTKNVNSKENGGEIFTDSINKINKNIAVIESSSTKSNAETNHTVSEKSTRTLARVEKTKSDLTSTKNKRNTKNSKQKRRQTQSNSKIKNSDVVLIVENEKTPIATENKTETEKNRTDNKSSETQLENKKDSISAVLAETKQDSLTQAKKDSITETNNAENSLVKKDSTVHILPLDDSKFAFFAVLGAQYNLGFSKNDGNSFSPYVGAMFQYKFSKTWAFSTGLGVYRISNLNFEKQITERSYDFGYRDKITNIQQKQIYYLSIPLEINKIIGKNKLAFGLNPNLMIVNKTEVSTFENSSLKQSNPSTVSSFKHGYGLNPLDLQLSLAYCRSLGNKWQVGASYHFGLLDVRNSSWTKTNSTERNQFIRFNLIYKIK